jgi:hypothetical protein
MRNPVIPIKTAPTVELELNGETYMLRSSMGAQQYMVRHMGADLSTFGMTVEEMNNSRDKDGGFDMEKLSKALNMFIQGNLSTIAVAFMQNRDNKGKDLPTPEDIEELTIEEGQKVREAVFKAFNAGQPAKEDIPVVEETKSADSADSEPVPTEVQS